MARPRAPGDIKEGRRTAIIALGAILAPGLAGCLGGGEADSGGDGVPDEDGTVVQDDSTPTQTTEENTPEPVEDTSTDTEIVTETTPNPDEPVSMGTLENESPAIAEAVQSYNNTEYEAVVNMANYIVQDQLDLGEAVLQPSSTVNVYPDLDAEEAADRYIAQFNFETNLTSSYADITDYIEGGALTDRAEEVFTYLFGEIFNRSLDKNKQEVAKMVAPNRPNSDQDAFNEAKYTVEGAEGGRVDAELRGKYLKSAAEWAADSDKTGRGPLREIAAQQLEPDKE